MADSIFVELTQKKIEDYEAGLPPLGSRAAISNGAIVRSAIKAGWFAEPPYKVDEIAGLLPSKVNALARKIGNEYQRVMVFDPE